MHSWIFWQIDGYLFKAQSHQDWVYQEVIQQVVWLVEPNQAARETSLNGSAFMSAYTYIVCAMRINNLSREEFHFSTSPPTEPDRPFHKFVVSKDVLELYKISWIWGSRTVKGSAGRRPYSRPIFSRDTLSFWPLSLFFSGPNFTTRARASMWSRQLAV